MDLAKASRGTRHLHNRKCCALLLDKAPGVGRPAGHSVSRFIRSAGHAFALKKGALLEMMTPALRFKVSPRD
jgi:hypothetical protein